MKLQQLEYICEIERSGCNISATSDKLFTSQPGISKQLGLLESELGVKIFERKGKHLFGTTEIGAKVIQEANLLLEVRNRIKDMCDAETSPEQGSLNIHTTNAIANFLLPEPIQYFINKYPMVSLNMIGVEPNTPLPKGSNYFCIVAQDVSESPGFVVLPAYKWSLKLIVPSEHYLANAEKITLEQLADEKLISYESKSTGREAIDKAFNKQGLTPNYIITTMDAGTIKEYVKLGVGIGILASVSTNLVDDSIVVRSLEELIPECDAWICYSKEIYLHKYMYDFIEKICPHLTRTVIERVTPLTALEREKWFESVELKTYR